MAYILVSVAVSLGLDSTTTSLFEGIWFEQHKIIDEGMVASWFSIVPWAIKYFNAYPVHVIVGLVSVWKTPIVFLGGISFAASWSGLSKDKPEAKE